MVEQLPKGCFVTLVAGTRQKEKTPAHSGRTIRSRRMATGGMGFKARPARLAWPTVLPCLRRTRKTGANAKGTTASKDAIRRDGNPDRPARLRDGSHSLFPLVAPARLEGSSVGRAAGCYPARRGFDPLPSSQMLWPPRHIGGGRTNQTPANAVRHYSLERSWSRVRIPPCAHSHVAQPGRARRVAKPLSPGPMM